MLGGMALTPFSPSIVSGVGWWQSEHDTSVFCSLAHLVTHPSQKVWPHSKSKGMRFPIGLVTSEELICNIIFMLIIQENFQSCTDHLSRKNVLFTKQKERAFIFATDYRLSLCILLKLLQKCIDINDRLFCKSAGIHKVTALNSDPSSTPPP